MSVGGFGCLPFDKCFQQHIMVPFQAVHQDKRANFYLPLLWFYFSHYVTSSLYFKYVQQLADIGNITALIRKLCNHHNNRTD